MEVILFLMDNFLIHLAHYPRRMPSGLPVKSVLCASAKRQHVHYAFETFNFSVILEGGGRYTFRGQTWEVEAPCVFIQWPGEMMDYGPSGRWDQWCELSILYAPEQLEALCVRNLALERKPIWPVRRASRMQEHVQELEALAQDPGEDGVVDRIDRICELLIVESRLGELRPPLGREEAMIREIRQHVRAHYAEHHDFDALARSHGLSPSTFRRYWNRYVHTTPARYVTQLRLREACRLLVESDASIGEIAGRLNFDDPLYFSRCFSEQLGMPATEYRRRNVVLR
jgi:AraC-like DNA-binding protein